ncbi:MAG: DegT/DnrJ/EryC1/StrS family aminotransferase [Bacteroidota bacterium]|nr:DegT/DnrJ/EryC1/StrS family aminotransferase [Bacteroidota bacterium]
MQTATSSLAIQMVDLTAQHARIQHELDAAMEEVVAASAFIRGPQVELFENALAAYLDAKHVIGCANGTDALQLALMALDLPPGTEVITADFTFVATAEVIRLLGLTPVLVDVDPDTFLIDPYAIEEAITSRTGAIIPVHLFGQCADMERIMAIAEKDKIFVIEDNAQALGATCNVKSNRRRKAGTIGHIGCTSFFPSKNLGAMGDGGAVITNDSAMAEKIRIIANHGQGSQYQYERIGINSRLDTIQAAILEVKLKHLDEYNRLRQLAAQQYDAALSPISDLRPPVRVSGSDHIFHQYTLKVRNGKRDALMQHLQASGIPSKVYYPLPLHKYKPYEGMGRNIRHSLELATQVLSLPMHTELTTEQTSFISSKVKNFFDKK